MKLYLPSYSIKSNTYNDIYTELIDKFRAYNEKCSQCISIWTRNNARKPSYNETCTSCRYEKLYTLYNI